MSDAYPQIVVVLGVANSPTTYYLYKGLRKLLDCDMLLVNTMECHPGDWWKHYLLMIGSKILHPSRPFVGREYLSEMGKRKVDINSPEFVDMIKKLKKSNRVIAFSFACRQKINPELFDYAVNYHDSILPYYSGTDSTAFSMHFKELETGYTFQKISDKIDGGDILYQVAFSARKFKHVEQAIRYKLKHAVNALPYIWECCLRNKEGFPQVGEGSYYGLKDYRSMIG